LRAARIGPAPADNLIDVGLEGGGDVEIVHRDAKDIAVRGEEFIEQLVRDRNGGLRLGGLRFGRGERTHDPRFRHVRHGMVADVAQKDGVLRVMPRPEPGEAGGEGA